MKVYFKRDSFCFLESTVSAIRLAVIFVGLPRR